MQSTFQWRLVLEASVGELLWLFLLFLGSRHNFVPACGGRPVNCSKILCSSAASFSSIIYPAWGEWEMRRTHDFICLFASLMENRRRDLKWEFSLIWNAKSFEGFKSWERLELHLSRSCTGAPLKYISQIVWVSVQLFICHDSCCPDVSPESDENWEMTSNLWTGRPSRPITTIDGFTTARLSSANYG